MWHHHILDTQHYMSVCFSTFGAMIHHNPDDTYLVCEERRVESTKFAYISHFRKPAPCDIWYFEAEKALILTFMFRGEKTAIKMKQCAPMLAIFETFARSIGFRLDGLMFFSPDNEPLYGDGTAGAKGLSDGDIIECIVEDGKNDELGPPPGLVQSCDGDQTNVIVLSKK